MTENANTANTASRPINGSGRTTPPQQPQMTPAQLAQIKKVRQQYDAIMTGLKLKYPGQPGTIWVEATNILTSMIAMVLAECSGNNSVMASAASFEVIAQLAGKLQLTIATMGQTKT